MRADFSSVRLSFHPHGTTEWMNCYQIWCLIIFRKSVHPSIHPSIIRNVVKHPIGLNSVGKGAGTREANASPYFFYIRIAFFSSYLERGKKQECWMSVGERGVCTLSTGSNQFFPFLTWLLLKVPNTHVRFCPPMLLAKLPMWSIKYQLIYRYTKGRKAQGSGHCGRTMAWRWNMQQERP